MTYSSLFRKNNSFIKYDIIKSKRTAKARKNPKNYRKLSVKLGQIVYYVPRYNEIQPMVVMDIEVLFSLWRRKYDDKSIKQPSNSYTIYYWISPIVITKNNKFVIKKYSKEFGINKKSLHNYTTPFKKPNKNSFVWHSVDLDDFFLTYAEARWYSMTW